MLTFDSQVNFLTVLKPLSLTKTLPSYAAIDRIFLKLALSAGPLFGVFATLVVCPVQKS